VTETLRFEEVSLSYRISHSEAQVVAVDDVSMSVAAGELVMIYGPSGAGKSTLLNLAATLLVPERGRVLFEGRDLADLTRSAAADYRKHEIGCVTQNFMMMNGPAVENAALKLMGTGVRWKEAVAQVVPILRRLGLDPKKQRRNAFDLSMGERQRMMIARALSTAPRLLLADEPTSHLDSRNSEEVLAVLRELCHERGLATLMVTHDASLADLADRSYELRDGRLFDYERGAARVDAVSSE
jgi:putative ABC transport system ATP-binding protein